MSRPRKLPQRLTREEAAALTAQPNRRYPTGIRDRALIRLMYRAGLRCDEALSLRPRDIQLAAKEIRVNEGKGGKDRVLWLDPTTVEYLERWRDVRPRSAPVFFCTLKGTKLDDSAIRHMLARRGRKAGIEIRCHPHLLRHSFASEFLEDGGTLVELQAALGHDRLETTAIYAHASNDRLRRFLVERPG